ncbi:MAG: hypothetical protein JXA94_05595 [Parachlamydiales bacterium]|nr:hypothetical protein [Parachlamydiales bacterium]
MIISWVAAIRDGLPLESKCKNESSLTSIKRRFQLEYEIGLKEITFVISSIFHYIISLFQKIYHTTPVEPEIIKKKTKIIIFTHGLGGGSFNFYTIAKKLKKVGINNLYAIDYSRRKDDLIPTKILDDMILTIAKKCFEKGAENVEFVLIGHSLGALISHKYILKIASCKNFDKRIKISKVISIAGLLKYTTSKFSWFYKNLQPQLDELYEAYKKNPPKTDYYTIRGELDELIPQELVHIQGDKNRQYTISNIGHGGVVTSDLTHKKIIEIVKT